METKFKSELNGKAKSVDKIFFEKKYCVHAFKVGGKIKLMFNKDDKDVFTKELKLTSKNFSNLYLRRIIKEIINDLKK